MTSLASTRPSPVSTVDGPPGRAMAAASARRRIDHRDRQAAERVGLSCGHVFMRRIILRGYRTARAIGYPAGGYVTSASELRDDVAPDALDARRVVQRPRAR